jgi:hypothetical protein
MTRICQKELMPSMKIDEQIAAHIRERDAVPRKFDPKGAPVHRSGLR